MTKKKAPTAANGDLEELRELVENSAEVAGLPAPATQSRRNLLKLAGAALAGAAGAAALKVIPAAASDGQAVLQGCINFADSTTTLTAPTGGNGPLTITAPAFVARGSVGLRGAGYYASDRNQSIGVLGLSKNDISIFATDPNAIGPGTGVMGIIDSGIAVEGDANTGVGGRFLSNTGYDVQLGALAGDSGTVGSGRLAMIGRGDVGGTAPNWAANFYVHSSLGILNFQHELVRGNDSSIWASRYDDTSPTRTRWKRINAVRVDSADGLGAPYAPYRVYDSRAGAAPKKAVGSTTTVPIAGHGTGNSTIPFDAIAVMGNLTATGYTAPGFLALSPNGVTVSTSSVNFITGQAAIANSFIVGLAGGAVQVKVAGSATHFIIDITGYIQ